MGDSDLAMARLSEHLLYLANRLIKAAGALPDGKPWVEVAGVAMELTRLGRLFEPPPAPLVADPNMLIERIGPGTTIPKERR